MYYIVLLLIALNGYIMVYLINKKSKIGFEICSIVFAILGIVAIYLVK